MLTNGISQRAAIPIVKLLGIKCTACAALLWLCLPILLFTVCTLRWHVKGNSPGAALVGETAVSLLKV